MLNIAICDDDTGDRLRVTTLVESYLHGSGIAAKVFTYDNPDKLGMAIENSLYFDIIFLDIIMGEQNGMTCARFIRRQDKLAKIIFVTNTTDFVYDGYEVNATGYLVKPASAHKIAGVLETAISQLSEIDKASIHITQWGVTQKVLIHDIVYFESENNKVYIHLIKAGERIAVYAKLDEFEQQSKTFIRTHKSFLVNFLYIDKYAKEQFSLNDGTEIPISRANQEKVREKFYKLLGEEMT